MCRPRTFQRILLVVFLALAGHLATARTAAALSPPPSLVARTVSSSQIALSWVDPNDGETSFAIERSLAPAGGFVQIGHVGRSTTTYQSNALASGTTYYFRVRALALGSGSSYSNVASATTTGAGSDSTPPSVSLTSPASGTTYTTAQTVTLAAVASDSTGVTRVEFYDGAALRCTATTPSYNCTWALTNADNGTHVWTAKAYDAAGNSAASSAITLAVNIATADTAPPSVPTSLTTTAASCSQINLGWNAATDTGGSGVRGYNLYRNGAFLKQVLTPTTSTSDPGLSASTTYSYTVAAVDNAGNASAQSSAVSRATPACANVPPVANAGPDQVSQSLTALTFSGGGSADPDGTITSCAWNFGDGTSGTGVTVSHAYARAGTYTVTLTVTDNVGLTATDTALVTATNRPPVASAGPDQTASVGASVTFSGSGSSDPDGSITSYAWTFGDGGSASGMSVSHAFTTAGTFTVTLTVTDNSGATRTDTATVTTTSTPSARGELSWVAALGSTYDDQGRAVAVDAQGNVLTAGHFRETVDFGGGPLTAMRLEQVAMIPSDIFVAKYSATGHHLWSIRIGSYGDDSASSIAVDGNGDVLVTGFVSLGVDFGGGSIPSLGRFDLFLAKYSGLDGRYLWARRFGGSGDEYSYGIAVDGAGNVTITGEFQGTADFGGGPLSSAGDRDIFVAQYSGFDGSHRWSKRIGGPLADIGLGVAVDSLDNVLVTGYFRDAANFGGGTLTSAGDRDIFLAKYTSSGAHVWSKRLGSSGADTGWGLAVDGSDNIVLTGGFAGAVDFGGGPLSTPSSGSDGFLAKYSSTGTHVWSRRFGGTNSDQGRAVAVDGTGDVTVTGLFAGSMDFGSGPLTSAGSFEIFVAKYSAAGVHLWAHRFGGTGDERSQSVAAAPDGSVVVTGYFPGTVDFGDGPMTSAGMNDIFLFRLAP